VSDAGESGSCPPRLLVYVRHGHKGVVVVGRCRLLGAAVVPDPEPLGVPRIVAVVTTDRACLAMRLMLEPDMERRGRGQGRRTRHAQEGHESARTPRGAGHLTIVDCFRFHVNNPPRPTRTASLALRGDTVQDRALHLRPVRLKICA